MGRACLGPGAEEAGIAGARVALGPIDKGKAPEHEGTGARILELMRQGTPNPREARLIAKGKAALQLDIEIGLQGAQFGGIGARARRRHRNRDGRQDEACGQGPDRPVPLAC